MRAVGSPGLSLHDVIVKLRKEGWHVRPHHVAYALRCNVLAQPLKRGGWHCYTQRHVDAMRRYLAERSRSQPRRAGK